MKDFLDTKVFSVPYQPLRPQLRVYPAALCIALVGGMMAGYAPWYAGVPAALSATLMLVWIWRWYGTYALKLTLTEHELCAIVMSQRTRTIRWQDASIKSRLTSSGHERLVIRSRSGGQTVVATSEFQDFVILRELLYERTGACRA